MRVSVGQDVKPLMDIISDLSLSVWRGIDAGVPIPNGQVDLVVSADKIIDFMQATRQMETKVMHEDLGASMAEEEAYHQYVGEFGLFSMRLIDCS